MKKNAFTLVELIGVIVILAAIALIAFPPLLNQIQKSQNEIDEATEQLVINSAQLYIDKNDEQFPSKNGNVYCVSFEDLINSGYLRENMVNQQEDVFQTNIVKVSYNNNYIYEVVSKDECTVINN